jgi:hypothetical protein
MTERTPTNPDDALNDFWNELVWPTGSPESGGFALDAGTADTVRDLHRRGSAPPPASSRERVRQGLRHARQTTPNGKEPHMYATAGHVTHAPPHRPSLAGPRRHAWWRPALTAATAIAVLLAVVIGGTLFDRSGSHQPTTIPGAVVQASPSPTADGETVLDITIPAELLPESDTISSAFAWDTLQPGKSGTWEPICCTGLLLEFVQSGTYTVQAEDEIHLIRAGGDLEPVEAGTEVTLEAGDALLTEITVAMESANNGAEPVELLNWFYVDDPMSVFGGKAFPGFVQNSVDIPFTVPDLTGPLTVQIRHVDLEPGTRIEPEAGTILLGLTPGGQTGYLTDAPDESFEAMSFEDTPVSAWVLTVEGQPAG